MGQTPERDRSTPLCPVVCQKWNVSDLFLAIRPRMGAFAHPMDGDNPANRLYYIHSAGAIAISIDPLLLSLEKKVGRQKTPPPI
jgi:hypothetical protein